MNRIEFLTTSATMGLAMYGSVLNSDAAVLPAAGDLPFWPTPDLKVMNNVSKV